VLDKLLLDMSDTAQKTQTEQESLRAAQQMAAAAAAANAAAFFGQQQSMMIDESKSRGLMTFDYPVKRKNFDHINDRELRKKLKNRESAQIARERAKAKMIQLERLVAELTETNRMLEFENHRLKARMCQMQGIRNMPNQMQNAQWLQQQQALAQQQAQIAASKQPNLIKNSNDPSCTQGTVTVKQEAPDVTKPSHTQIPSSVCQNLLAGTKRSLEQSSCSDRTTSNESNSISNLLERPMKAPKFEMDSDMVMNLLNGGLNQTTASSSTERSPKRENQASLVSLLKSDSGNESDHSSRNKTVSEESPDFKQIISDLKGEMHDFSGVTPTLNTTSTEAIFKDLINSLPL